MDTDTAQFRPPYMAFQTFWNFIADLAANPLPPAIDKSMMMSKSGTDKANLSAALTSFGLTGPNGQVLPALIELTSAEDRNAALRALIERDYAKPLRVSAENGTTAALNDVFESAYAPGSADTRRKAITFFLHASRQAGLELSPYFPSTRAGSGAPGVSRAKRASPRRRSARPGGVSEPVAPTSERPTQSHTVTLRSGGTVSVTADVNVFTLDSTDQAFFLSLVNGLREYQHAHASDNGDEE